MTLLREPDRVHVPAPLLPSKNTLSVVFGTDAPEEPPEVADQCVVDDVSHVHVPQTQKRDATILLVKS